MSDMIQTGFDYAALPVDSALTARAAAERIKLRLKRTVEDIIEIGRELTAVKADLPHGQFLPWIAAEFEMDQKTAFNFMSVYERFGSGKLGIIPNFKPTILYALSAPSTPEAVIEKAIEKAESGDKVTVADVKDWKAELEAERLRTQEFREESNERRKKIRELEAQLELSGRATQEPEIRVVEKAPDDYETAKRQASDLAAQTAALQQRLEAMEKQQGKIVSDGIKRGLQERQAELDKLEADKAMIEDIVARKKAYLDSLSSDVKRIETHREVINGARLELISLAAFLNDLEPMDDPDTINRWLALADMHQDAVNAIHQVFGNRRHKIEQVA